MNINLNMIADTGHDFLPLTSVQMPIWFDVQTARSAGYRLGCWASFQGRIRHADLKQSLKILIARHDGLRVRVDPHKPRQWISSKNDVHLTITEHHDIPEEEVNAALSRYIEHVFQQPMPYGDRPLFAVHLVEFENTSYLLWDFDHIIADSIGVRIALLHWFNAYQAVTSTEPVQLTPASSVLDLVQRDIAYSETPDYQRDLQYWVARFDPLPPALLLKEGQSRSDDVLAPTTRRRIEPDLARQLASASHTAGTQPQRSFFALFCLALARRFDQMSVTCGMALHQRDHKTFGTIGMAASLMPVISRYEPWWDLTEVVQAFSEDVDADLKHHRTPLDSILRALGPQMRERGGLFDVSVSWVPYGGSTDPDHAAYTIGTVDNREAVPIALHATENPQTGAIDYMIRVRPDHAAVIDGDLLAEHLEDLIRLFVEDEFITCEEIPRQSAREQALINGFASDQAELATEPCVLGRVLAHVEGCPEAVFVSAPGLSGGALSDAGQGGLSYRSV
ncbi:MAG: hypothetical protein JJU08_15005, partial [Rhodobacteraceae bacterium]|nr:hypothetical protein [Paracoccaceae bacterium]